MAGGQQSLALGAIDGAVTRQGRRGVYHRHLAAELPVQGVIFRTAQFVASHAEQVNQVAGTLDIHGRGAAYIIDLAITEKSSVGGMEILVSPIW